MAKKQSADAPDKAAPPAADQPAAEAKKEKAPKAPKEAKEAKAKPDAAAPAAPAAPAAEGAAPAPAAASPDAPTKKKGQQPGIPPRRGKKLRNQIKQQVQKIAKEGPVPLKRALQVLKGLKRAKF